MNEHTKIDYQIIEQDGKPAFAVVPYAQFKAFIDKTEDAIIPHSVARAMSVDGKSMLQAWREFKELTQAELAEVVSMSQPAIAQLEKSTSSMRESTLQKLARGLEIELNQLREL